VEIVGVVLDVVVGKIVRLELVKDGLVAGPVPPEETLSKSC